MKDILGIFHTIVVHDTRVVPCMTLSKSRHISKPKVKVHTYSIPCLGHNFFTAMLDLDNISHNLLIVVQDPRVSRHEFAQDQGHISHTTKTCVGTITYYCMI